MKKILLPIICLFMIVACQQFSGSSESSSIPEFIGTWQYTYRGETAKLNITYTTIDVTFSGSSHSKFSIAIISYDTTAKHILGRLTDDTGFYPFMKMVGNSIYITYNVMGNNLMMSMDFSDYPTSATRWPDTHD
jgi:hypothetical protein